GGDGGGGHAGGAAAGERESHGRGQGARHQPQGAVPAARTASSRRGGAAADPPSPGMSDTVLVPVTVQQLPPPLRPPVRCLELFEEALVGIYVARPDGTLISCNAAFARMLGSDSVAGVIGAAMSTVYDDPAERERFVASIREHGRLEHHRARLRRPGGGIVDVIETVVGGFDSGGTLVELRGFLIDVTTNVEAEL